MKVAMDAEQLCTRYVQSIGLLREAVPIATRLLWRRAVGEFSMWSELQQTK